MDIRTITGTVIDIKQNSLLSVYGNNGSVGGRSRVRTTLIVKDQEGSESAVVLDDDLPARIGHRVTAILVRGQGDWQTALFRNHDLKRSWRFHFDVANDWAFTHFVLAAIFGAMITIGGVFTLHSAFERNFGLIPVAIGLGMALTGAGWICAAYRARLRPNEKMLARARQALASVER